MHRSDAEQGVQQVSQTLFHRVTSYHAQIGANVNRETLQALEWQLLSEAKALFHRKEYEESLNTFTHCLAVTEKTRSSKDATVRGAIVHNIASCLHHLGELEAAQAYYEQAIQAFEKAKTPFVEKMMYGDTNKRRIDFVKERLIDISWGRKPDGDKYLDENGHKRPVPLGALAGQRGDGAGHLSRQWATEEPPPPPWALADEEAAAADYPYARRPAWMSAVHGEGEADGHYDADDVEVNMPEAHDGRGAQRIPERAEDSYFVDSRMMSHNVHQSTGGVLQSTGRGGGGGGGAYGEEMDDATQERARKEWLQYHLQTSNWAAAEELIVTQDEREDLDYLIERERRFGYEGGEGGGAAPDEGPSGAEAYDNHEDFDELNEAAVAAAAADRGRPPAGGGRGGGAGAAAARDPRRNAPPPQHAPRYADDDDDDDDML